MDVLGGVADASRAWLECWTAEAALAMNSVCIAACGNTINTTVGVPNVWSFRLIHKLASGASWKRLGSTKPTCLVLAICKATGRIRVMLLASLIPVVLC